VNALLVGQEPSRVLRNALICLNICTLQRVGGENVAVLPWIFTPAVEVVIIFADSASRKLADRVRRDAGKRSIPVLCCRPSVSALAVEWCALRPGERGGGNARGRPPGQASLSGPAPQARQRRGKPSGVANRISVNSRPSNQVS
jgi:hypothetical protein